MNDLEELKPQQINFQVESDDDLKRLTLILRKVDESIKKIAEKLDPEISNAYKTHKGLTALKKETVKPWEDVKEKINNSIKVWYSKKEQEAKLLQDKVNEQLAKQAEEERQRIIKESENSTSEWDKQVGIEKAQAIVPVTVNLEDCKETVAPKQEGQYKRSNWKCRVINENLVPEAFWSIDSKKLDDYAKKFKQDGLILGCEIYDDFTIVTKI